MVRSVRGESRQSKDHLMLVKFEYLIRSTCYVACRTFELPHMVEDSYPDKIQFVLVIS